MHRLWKKHLILLAVVIACVSGCTNKESADQQDQLDHIQQKIDQKMYDSAIAELEQILTKEPDHKRARTILASVYIHRSGLSVREYFQLQKIFNNDDDSVQPLLNIEVLESFEVKKDSDLGKAINFLKELNKVTFESQKLAKKFAKIPDLDLSQAKDVYQALLELEKLKEPTRGMSLYRGMIKLIYFKYLWESDQFLKVKEHKICSTSIRRLNDQLEIMKNYTVSMIKDVAEGVPKSEEDFKKNADQINKAISQTQKTIRGLGDLQATVNEVVSQVVQTADIKGFKCNF